MIIEQKLPWNPLWKDADLIGLQPSASGVWTGIWTIDDIALEARPTRAYTDLFMFISMRWKPGPAKTGYLPEGFGLRLRQKWSR